MMGRIEVKKIGSYEDEKKDGSFNFLTSQLLNFLTSRGQI